MGGWLAIGALAAAYDAWAIRGHHDTLSCAAGRHPAVSAVACAALLAHFNSDNVRRHMQGKRHNLVFGGRKRKEP